MITLTELKLFLDSAWPSPMGDNCNDYWQWPRPLLGKMASFVWQ